MSVVVTCVALLLFTAVSIADRHNWWRHEDVTKAVRYAVTLKGNGGEFLALCTEKHRDRWVFEDIKIMPANPGGPVLKAHDGKLHVPVANILYYQEIVEIANVAE